MTSFFRRLEMPIEHNKRMLIQCDDNLARVMPKTMGVTIVREGAHVRQS